MLEQIINEPLMKKTNIRRFRCLYGLYICTIVRVLQSGLLWYSDTDNGLEAADAVLHVLLRALAQVRLHLTHARIRHQLHRRLTLGQVLKTHLPTDARWSVFYIYLRTSTSTFYITY